LYGTPFFYTTTNGTPIQGGELNEYGLLAAYSLLGVTNRCYVLRADIDLASLVGQAGRPVGAPASGSYWLDTATSTWGIYEFNQTTGKFTNKVPRVLTEDAYFSGTFPLQSIGNIGDYAIDSRWKAVSDPVNDGQYFYKTLGNIWVKLGSSDWLNSMPTVRGTGDPRVFDGVTGDLTQTQVVQSQVISNYILDNTISIPATAKVWIAMYSTNSLSGETLTIPITVDTTIKSVLQTIMDHMGHFEDNSKKYCLVSVPFPQIKQMTVLN
jgi:hypothetical protein